MTNRQKGIACAVTGGVFWGGSGVAGQYLLQDASFATEWIVTVRLVFGGLILLAMDAMSHHGDIFRVWKLRQNVVELLFFGVFGLMAVSYTYFASIRYGNAAAATVLQYLMPAFMASTRSCAIARRRAACRLAVSSSRCSARSSS
ncbi:DMT family transporter [uncultured Selenomonas sp.]|uniref:DMT family transporter n=1 Tax=uncultured Selenomonas sp. TaxID=159275 RepID=UPI0025F54D1E|nr:DMT family transporter [uncultured Selenomonas sp.]